MTRLDAFLTVLAVALALTIATPFAWYAAKGQAEMSEAGR